MKSTPVPMLTENAARLLRVMPCTEGVSAVRQKLNRWGRLALQTNRDTPLVRLVLSGAWDALDYADENPAAFSALVAELAEIREVAQ